ncbi:MAG: hypothetical protein ABR980_09415 [Ignavibacteriaceae bacterium]|jgi:hypothetical protein
MDYPDFFLRGISGQNHVGDDDTISGAVFHFGGKDNVEERNDDYNEESIFWKDDEEAITLILSQKKVSGDLQFKVGAVVVNRKKVDNVIKVILEEEKLSYERKPDPKNPNNKYHGNLLLKKSTSNMRMKNIAGMLAECCDKLIRQKKG